MIINPELLALAEWRLNELQKQAMEKTAFTPPGGGAPPGGAPMDPAAMGGAPPMDPAAMGGAPPMDPAAMGGAPVPGGGGLTAESIAQIVTQTMQQGGGAAGAGAAGGPGAAGKMVKPDIATVAIDIFQVKKMLQYLFNTMGIQLPPDILDGPNRDPSTGISMPPGTPGSTSDPQVTAANAQQQQAQQGGGAGGAGGAIPPIEPMQAGGPGVSGEKMGMDRSLYMGSQHNDGFSPRLISKAAALSAIVRKLKER